MALFPQISDVFDLPFARTIYDPTTTWNRFFNPQFFISLNDEDAPIENKVLGRAGSYGKQLGTILDAVDVLARHLSTDDLTKSEQAVLNEFFMLRTTVENAKQEFRGGGSGPAAAVEGFLMDLERLRRVDVEAYTSAITRLSALLADAGGRTAESTSAVGTRAIDDGGSS